MTEKAKPACFIKLDKVGSTNSYAIEGLLSSRLNPPCWVMTLEQIAGRGRSGAWAGDKGNLAVSHLFVEQVPAHSLSQLAFVAGLALYDALSTVVPNIQDAFSLKWPNDVLLDGKKMAGILIEGRKYGDGHAIVVGWGVNCASHPQDTRWPATDLSNFGGAALGEALGSELAIHWDAWYQNWRQANGFAFILARWRDKAYGIGHRVEVMNGSQVVSGVMRGVDDHGALVIDDGDRLQSLVSGEVRLLPKAFL